MEINKTTHDFLAGDRDDIGEIDSLRKVREVMHQMRLMYRKTSQKNDAIRRQIAMNPETLKTHQEAEKKKEDELEEARKGQSMPGTANQQDTRPESQREPGDHDLAS